MGFNAQPAVGLPFSAFEPPVSKIDIKGYVPNHIGLKTKTLVDRNREQT